MHPQWLEAAGQAHAAWHLCKQGTQRNDKINCVTAITNAILDSRNVVITNKLDDESIGQLKTKYTEYLQNEAKLFKTHSNNIGTMLDQNKDKCYKIINRGDGVYFGRKTFMRLYVVFCIFTGIILLEVAYGLLKLFGG